MLIFGPSGSRKIDALLNLIQQQDNDSPMTRINCMIKP